jgi:hypothetical protein
VGRLAVRLTDPNELRDGELDSQVGQSARVG